MRRMTMLVRVIGLLALVVTVVALAAHQFAWTWQPAIVTAALAHQLMWAAPVAVALLLVTRRWWTAGAAAIALVLAAATQLPLYNSTSAVHGPSLTVLQANLRIGSAQPRPIVDLVRTHHVDVLTTEELTPAEEQSLIRAGLSRLLPYRFARPLAGGSGVAIWSRTPLRDEADHPGFALHVLSATTTVDGRTLGLVGVHLLPPWPYPSAEWLRETIRLPAVLRAAHSGNRPVVVGGDFNATTDNAQFRRLLRGGYADATEQAGDGYLPTYPTDRHTGPWIAIDHVLLAGAVATSAASEALPRSDHRGLLVHLALAR